MGSQVVVLGNCFAKRLSVTAGVLSILASCYGSPPSSRRGSGGRTSGAAGTDAAGDAGTAVTAGAGGTTPATGGAGGASSCSSGTHACVEGCVDDDSAEHCGALCAPCPNGF